MHGRYSCAEIEAAHCFQPGGYGVLWHQPTATDLLFVTLRKSEALFSPTTRYRDLALGPSLFHWESQSTTTAASGAVVCAGAAQAGRRHRAVPLPGLCHLRRP